MATSYLSYAYARGCNHLQVGVFKCGLFFFFFKKNATTLQHSFNILTIVKSLNEVEIQILIQHYCISIFVQYIPYSTELELLDSRLPERV